jgi:hypothetical protein
MRNPLLTFCLTIVLCWASSGKGQDWAKEMFSETTHDFGVVAAGAKVEHKIYIENKWEEDVHITSINSGCPCTSAKIDKMLLKSWEKAEITVSVNTDTRQYFGRKDATVTVKFDQPFPAEVQVHVHSYIRRDVVVQPGVVQFGSVAQGAAMKQKVSVGYAGRIDWRIDRVESANPFLEAQLSEVSRAAGQVKYDLWVTLKADAPAGYIQDQIVLVTNDVNPRSARVPVAVEGVVSQALSVRPMSLFMGVIEAGQQASKLLVVQGKTPFRITAVQPSDPRFQCKLPEGAKPVHLLPVIFNAKDASGKISGKIRIETDYPNTKPLEVDVNVQVTQKGVGDL